MHALSHLHASPDASAKLSRKQAPRFRVVVRLAAILLRVALAWLILHYALQLTDTSSNTAPPEVSSQQP